TNVVNAVHSTSVFSVVAPDSVNRNGNGLFPKYTGGGYVHHQTNVTFSTTLEHGLNVGDPVFVNFNASPSPPDDVYVVNTVPDATHFSIIVTNTANNRTDNGQTLLPLVAPPLIRSGNVTVSFSTWTMNNTDTGTQRALSQTPLASPTVFNYFFPDFKFPGILASAGLTTPEFQLTSDTENILQMNFLSDGLLGNTGNTNGLSSFSGGNGAITVDLGPWMTPGYTSNAGLPNLVDQLNILLCGGQLSAAAKTAIVNFASTLSYTTPTATQMRDRVRAVVHLIVTSPDFTIQR
ncbi:MAG TPA: hypothetical protein PKA41_19150, partial [Verrucomicrobiota bacterium]|nr:hypothetical protein [Verrucomicrobiota bacterium]